MNFFSHSMHYARAHLKSGFTLVEVLIVILIIALLMAFIIPSVMRGPAAGRDLVRVNHVNSIATAFEAYRSAKRTYPLVTSGETCLNPASGIGAELIREGFLTADKFPVDPEASATHNGCTNGSYFFRYLTVDGRANSAVIVGARLEQTGRATATAADLQKTSITRGETFDRSRTGLEYYHQISGL